MDASQGLERQVAESSHICHVCTGFLLQKDAWYAMNVTIMKTWEDPMMATTLAEQEWDFVMAGMAPIWKYRLPAMHVNRNLPKAVMYRPICNMRTNRRTRPNG